MKLTKYEHAALVLEKNGKKLVIDPGSFTAPLADSHGVVGIVITHEHADHWTHEHLTRIVTQNPGIPIYGPQGVADVASGFEVTVVTGGDTASVEPFSLRFFGTTHAVIHSSIPTIDNVGVLVDDTLYYPGDSFTVPEGVEVDVLAVPSSAPWLKVGEVIDYVSEVKPKRSFATHEMIHSQAGKAMTNGRIQAATEAGGGEFFALEPNDTLDL